MLNLCGIVVSILKMATGRNFSMSGINSGHHYLPTYQILMISDNVEFCGIVAAILKMVTGRNFSMLGINSGHHYLPTYQILMISGNVEFLPPIFYTVFFGSHFENGRYLENFENAELLL
jgi:putative Mn2+ efflux pump MntP